MDNFWERSIPIYKVDLTEINKIFHDFNHRLTVLSFKVVNIGCRNSNFIVETDLGTYVLRISPPNDNGYINEKAVYRLFKNIINIPTLYYTALYKNRACLIYEYINAVSLQSKCSDGIQFENDIIKQVAKTAALIHNLRSDEINEFTKLDLPPYITWYEFFLNNCNVSRRLGNETIKRVKRLIRENEANLCIIDSYQSFIHRDFRPANMLIDNNNVVFTVDWESAGMGHTLADIGQFFRYRNCFDKEQLSVFEIEYNLYATTHLPKNWFDLGKLRDLVNPLQMVGANDELPLKYEDLKCIILDTLEYFGY
jgi:Predicted aminoglycoside phosphotransferase